MYKAVLTGKGSVRIVNFITIGTGGLVLRRGYESHYSTCKYALSSALSMCIILIAVVLREYGAAFLCHC